MGCSCETGPYHAEGVRRRSTEGEDHQAALADEGREGYDQMEAVSGSPIDRRCRGCVHNLSEPSVLKLCGLCISGGGSRACNRVGHMY